MSQFLHTKREGYRAQRVASHATDITFVCGAGKYYASFECATKIAEVLGTRHLENADGVPQFSIATEDLYPALLKLSERYSIGLVDYVSYRSAETKFVLVWRIDRKPTTTLNLDDF